MKVRKIILLTLAFSLVFGSVVYADTVTQKLRIWVVSSKKEEVANGVVVDNDKVYVSADIITDKLQGILIKDEGDKKLLIYKPNVHMLTSSDNVIFGTVEVDKKKKFNTHLQVDSLKVDITALKLTIANPYGDETLIETRKSGDSDFPDGKNDFWLTMKDISYSFNSIGTYTLRFWVKPAGESSFLVISEKTIASK
jgi:hypothetical protein